MARYPRARASASGDWPPRSGRFTFAPAFTNAGVVLAALGVALTGSGWPDVVVGLGIAALFMASAFDVVRAALRPPVSSRAG